MPSIGEAAGVPQTLDHYQEWLLRVHGLDPQALSPNYFNAVSGGAHRFWTNSVFWQEVVASINEYNARYQVETAFPLFQRLQAPTLLSKSHNSFLLKTFRRNVIDNAGWPDPPEGGWMLHPSWLSRVNDVTRTCFVVQYLDGIEWLANQLRKAANDRGMESTIQWEAKAEGYYAVHLYVVGSVEVPRLNWDTERVSMRLEIQITTEVQETIRKLTHYYYARRRAVKTPADEKWQWNYRSDEFVANYLGHVLHYTEGMIMEIRERQRKATST